MINIIKMNLNDESFGWNIAVLIIVFLLLIFFNYYGFLIKRTVQTYPRVNTEYV